MCYKPKYKDLTDHINDQNLNFKMPKKTYILAQFQYLTTRCKDSISFLTTTTIVEFISEANFESQVLAKLKQNNPFKIAVVVVPNDSVKPTVKITDQLIQKLNRKVIYITLSEFMKLQLNKRHLLKQLVFYFYDISYQQLVNEGRSTNIKISGGYSHEFRHVLSTLQAKQCRWQDQGTNENKEILREVSESYNNRLLKPSLPPELKKFRNK